MKRDLLLWTPILISPLVWFISMEANFALAPLACDAHAAVWIYVVSFASILITAGLCGLAVSSWRTVRRDEQTAAGAPAERVRSMALAGVVLSAGFLLVVIAQTYPDFVLTGCQ